MGFAGHGQKTEEGSVFVIRPSEDDIPDPLLDMGPAGSEDDSRQEIRIFGSGIVSSA